MRSGVGGPDERLGALVVLGEVAVDRGLEVDQRAEGTALQPAAGERAKTDSTALAQEHEVGVKWKVQRGWRASLGCLWAAWLSRILTADCGPSRSLIGAPPGATVN
jgi:hypothetical protein